MRDPAKKPVSFIYALRGPLHSIIFFLLINALFGLAWENSRHLATPLLVFPPNDVWETRAESPWLMTRHYPDLGRASDRSCRVGNLIQPIRSTTQIWVMTRHQYGISALVSQASFGGETSNSVAKCRLYSQGISSYTDVSPVAPTPFGSLLLLLCVCVCVVLQIYIVYY